MLGASSLWLTRPARQRARMMARARKCVYIVEICVTDTAARCVFVRRPCGLLWSSTLRVDACVDFSGRVCNGKMVWKVYICICALWAVIIRMRFSGIEHYVQLSVQCGMLPCACATEHRV